VTDKEISESSKLLKAALDRSDAGFRSYARKLKKAGEDDSIEAQYDACLEDMLGCYDAAVDAYVKENLCLLREMAAAQRIAERTAYAKAYDTATRRLCQFAIAAVIVICLVVLVCRY
jgi:hypothetical protein